MKLIRKTSIKILSILFVVSVFTTSCEDDFLDTKVDISLTKENLDTNYATIFEFANAPYTYLDNVSNGFSALDNNLFAVASDEALQTRNGNNESNAFTQGLMSPYNNPDDVYATCYQGIRAANYFLENYQDYPEVLAYNRDIYSDNGIQYNLDVQDIGYYMAEIRVLRAYYYYELIKRYGSVPLLENTLSVEDDIDIPRSNFSEIVDFIISEIDAELLNLQPNWKTFDVNKAGRITRAVALAIKMRVLMLYASPLHNPTNDITRWQNAASLGNEIISLNQFSLANNYRNLFIADNTVSSPETIWAIRLNATNALERINYPLSTAGGNNEITPSHNIVAAYEYKGAANPDNIYENKDPRLAASIVTNGSSWTGREIQIWAGGTDDFNKANISKTGYYLKKFMNDNLNLIQNQSQQRAWIVFRYGEILLNYAEAMNNAYGPDNDNGFGLTARDAVNQIRNRPGVEMPSVAANNQSDLAERIKHERRIELAFEGHRYWDLIRWKDAENALNAPITGVRATKESSSQYSYTIINVESRDFEAPKRYFYPFSQTEIIRSGDVLTQNPNW